jgi:hypothetical protein
MADSIVTWVNANGGEAQYRDSQSGPHIAIRTINGWAYAEPGHYVVMGEATFDVHIQSASDDERNDTHRQCRDFYPCDPEMFARRWSLVVSENPEDTE